MHQDPSARIEAEIRGRFSAEIELEPATLHFIESTYDAASAGALAGLLASLAAGDGEMDVLADLLFSPDEALCCRIERHLSPEGLSAGQRSRIAGRLRRAPLVARIRAGSGPIRVSMPDDLVDGFLDRLCLDRPLDAALASGACERYPEADALQVRFRLRQAGLCGSDGEKEALIRLMAARKPGDEDFWPLLETLIGFLTSASAARDLFAALTERKQACLRHLRQAADRSRALERHNIETILIGGDRMPHVDAEALAREVVHIDDLGRILFGTPVPAPAAGLQLDLGRGSGSERLDRLMRIFTKP